MGTLAKRVLDELDRAGDLTSFRVRRARRDVIDGDRALPAAANTDADAQGDLIPPPTACHNGVGAAPMLVSGERGVANGGGGDDQ